MHPLEGGLLSASLPEDRLVAVLKFREGFPVPQNPAVLFQATIDPNKISPSGYLIRFGQTPGDEVNGWQRRDMIEVIEVLGILEEDNKTVTPIEGEQNVRTG